LINWDKVASQRIQVIHNIHVHVKLADMTCLEFSGLEFVTPGIHPALGEQIIDITNPGISDNF